MNELVVNLKNCYGIKSLNFKFDFSKKRTYSIYAPNGSMKTSFTKTFFQLSNGNEPCDERFNRKCEWIISTDGVDIAQDAICVLKSDPVTTFTESAITALLVDPTQKALYDGLILNLNSLKDKLIGALAKESGVTKTALEGILVKDWAAPDILEAIKKIRKHQNDDDLSKYKYGILFDEKAQDVLNSPGFIKNAKEFHTRYHQIFSSAGNLYKKGIFNPSKAEETCAALEKNKYFEGGHLVSLQGETEPFSKEQFRQKLDESNAAINSDAELNAIKSSLTKNKERGALNDLIEALSATEIDDLLSRLENKEEFKRDLWNYHIRKTSQVDQFWEIYDKDITEIRKIQKEAQHSAPRWKNAIELFNDRFVDMPFTLQLNNQGLAMLGLETPELVFNFRDSMGEIDCNPQVALKTLSQGEKRALYLLIFIFDVEVRKASRQETLFILDDIADSFDYKNKHAIIQYLKDLSEIENFYQIILTHNFDFMRALANLHLADWSFALMANRTPDGLTLQKALGIKNYFVDVMKDKILECPAKLCASIPFIRNLIEYIRPANDADYQNLTSLLHWKVDTGTLSVTDYLIIYDKLFTTEYAKDDHCPGRLVDLLFNTAEAIRARKKHDSLCLEDKIVLSMASRLKAEQYMTSRLRELMVDPVYWCPKMPQFGKLLKEYKKLSPESPNIRLLEKVRITVNSNIHINSFMYEPILDLTIDHLVKLYGDVCELCKRLEMK